jgi:hypothetical protein
MESDITQKPRATWVHIDNSALQYRRVFLSVQTRNVPLSSLKSHFTGDYNGSVFAARKVMLELLHN